MKAFLLGLCWLPLAASAQSAFSELHPPHLAGYYDGTLNGKLAIHAYFFPTDKDLAGLLNGFYRYGQRKQDLHLVGGLKGRDSLLLEEYTVPTMDVAARTGHLRLQFQADGGLRGTWRAEKGGPRLPLELHPVAGPGPATCPPARLVRHAKGWPTLSTTDKQAAAAFTGSLEAELALNESDPGTQECTVEYVGHNLVSVWLTSEMRGASIFRSHRWSTFDACTGLTLSAEEEIDPHRLSAFLEEANSRLRQQIEDYIAERGPQGSDPLLAEEDVQGLRAQEFTLDSEQFRLEAGQVVFPHQVRYDMLSNFISKDYAGRFGAAFSFADVQSFLRPASPLHRLVLPEAMRPTLPNPKPPRKPTTRKPRQ